MVWPLFQQRYNWYMDTQSGTATGAATTINTWYHVGLTRTGTVYTLYVDGVSAFTLTTSDTYTNDNFYLIENNAGSAMGGQVVAGVKLWDGVALSAAQVDQERRYYRPMTNLASLYAWLPMVHPTVNSNALDWSGLAHDWTVTGTLTQRDGPPIAWAPRWQRWASGIPAGGTANPLSLSGSLTGAGSLVRRTNKPFAGVI